MDKLPIEIASNVLKFFDFNELINISAIETLPSNFDHAIKDKRIWKRKILVIKSDTDFRRCLKDIFNIRHCTRVSFVESNLNAAKMVTLLSNIDSIEQLSLDNFVDLDDKSMAFILEKHGKSLKHLSIKGCHYLTNYSLDRLSRHCNNLISLNISECSFSSCGLELIVENENLITSLRSFDISKCFLLDQGAILPLSKLKNLRTLCLRNLDWLSALNLPVIIKYMTRISKLYVRNCDEFTKQNLDQVKASIEHPIEILENTKLFDDSAESIRGYLMSIINSQII